MTATYQALDLPLTDFDSPTRWTSSLNIQEVNELFPDAFVQDRGVRAMPKMDGFHTDLVLLAPADVMARRWSLLRAYARYDLSQILA